jgi:hypothetical protein
VINLISWHIVLNPLVASILRNSARMAGSFDIDVRLSPPPHREHSRYRARAWHLIRSRSSRLLQAACHCLSPVPTHIVLMRGT